jgi:hypothetical protein
MLIAGPSTALPVFRPGLELVRRLVLVFPARGARIWWVGWLAWIRRTRRIRVPRRVWIVVLSPRIGVRGVGRFALSWWIRVRGPRRVIRMGWAGIGSLRGVA